MKIFLVILAVVLLGVCGLLVWLIIRGGRTLKNPELFFGRLTIRLSHKTQNKILVDDIEEWLKELNQKWKKQDDFDVSNVENHCKDTLIHLDDVAYYSLPTGRKAAGFTYIPEKLCYLSTINGYGLVSVERIKDLFLHELSHIIYADLAGSYNEVTHHEYFKKIGV